MTEKKRPSLLFVSHVLPFPQDSGARIRTFNVLRMLSDAFDITALCFYRRSRDGRQDSVHQSVQMLLRFADVQAFPIPQQYSRFRQWWDHVRSVIYRKPYTHFVYGGKQFKRALERTLNHKVFDLVHLDSLDLARYLPTFNVPVICSHHNIESELLRRRAAIQGGLLAGPYLKVQAGFMERVEKHWAAAVAMNVVVSGVDARRLKELSHDAAVTVVPNGIDTKSLLPESNGRGGIVFVGSYDWAPNRDAMAFFCREVLPVIRAAHPAVPVTWVGHAPGHARAEYQRRHDVHLTGYVEDVRPFVRRASCCVVPLRAGGGSRLKILEAWALGKAVVSTSVGCEGLAAENGQNILIRDVPSEFAAAVIDILESAHVRHGLEASARRTAEEMYDWDRIAPPLIRLYLEVAGVDRVS